MRRPNRDDSVRLGSVRKNAKKKALRTALNRLLTRIQKRPIIAYGWVQKKIRTFITIAQKKRGFKRPSLFL
ncbi:hypothetical protein B2M26_07595 [Ferroacidibacillus organovorans]|uniref:Uncharacterized protein n=1 Tax=Ferroacidibacillus organovorans TaxID=1765683 RepID=A0A1V4ETK0_9BACL|nr:hypothetical protein B2M26_07595 [Ferroacidibacillus organovorans]